MARRVTLGLLIAAAALLALTHGADVAAFVTTARGGSASWLAVAALLQIGYYLGYVLTYRQAFASVGIHRRLAELTPVMLASVFVNTVTPSAGTAGPALMIDDATRRGHETGASTAAVVIGQFADFAGFAVVMAAGFTYLAVLGRLTVLEGVTAVAFLALVAAIGGALVLALVRPVALERAFLVLERAASRVASAFRRPEMNPWAARVSAEFSAAVRLSARRPGAVVSAWLVAVVGHTLDLGCFIAVGWAFGWHPIGPLIAGYAVGIVVWLTSIVPQGVGVVEGSVALLLVSFGAPPATAAAISLTFRGLTFWLPFLAGFALLPRVSTFRDDREQAAGEFPAKAAAVLVFTVGVVNILSASTPGLAARMRVLESFSPFGVGAGHLATVLAGIALIMLSRGLWHHKRSAYLLTVALLAFSAGSHLLKGLDYEEAIIALAVMVWLLTEGTTFYAKPDAPSLRQGARALLAAFAITLAYGTAGFWLLDRHFSVNFGLWAAIRQTAVMFTQFYDPGLQPITGFGRYFADSIYLVGAVTFGFALIVLLRPVVIRRPATAEELERAEAIVEAHGGSALAALALLPDKSYWFSSGGSVIAYAVSGGVAVTLGDPIGPAEDLVDATRGFVEFATRNAWLPTFYETDDGSVPGYAEVGYSSTCVGYEAIVPLGEFTLSGKSYRTIRNTINRRTEEGFVAEVLSAPQPPRVLRELRDVSDVWLSTVKGSEKRFSLGWFDDDYIRDCDVMVVRSRLGQIVAFANVLSEYQSNELTIDLMRYRPEAPAGVMDFLFVKLFEWSRDSGFDTFNMGLSPLAGLGEDPEHGVTEKLLALVYEHGNALYGFRGLHVYKEKFHPRWEPRYLVYPDAASLPAVFAAVVRVNSGAHPFKSYIERTFSRSRNPDPASST
jgi:phosphatidylglycerol lysyltransferase